MRYLAIFAMLMLLAACNISAGRPPEQENVPPATSTPQTSTSNSDTQALSGDSSTEEQVSSSTCTIRTDWHTYTVVDGDTLGGIAARSGTSVEALADANCLTDADNINVRQVLRVPVALTSQSNTLHITPLPQGALPMVGNVAGMPDLNTCWVTNPGTQPVVYDRVEGNALARLGNRAVVISATSTGWVQIDFVGGANIASGKGWMRVDEIALIGPCSKTTGVDVPSFTPLVGNPAGVPNDVCAVAVINPTTTIPVYIEPDGRQFSNMHGWGVWLNTQGNFYRVEYEQEQIGWVDSSLTRRINC